MADWHDYDVVISETRTWTYGFVGSSWGVLDTALRQHITDEKAGTLSEPVISGKIEIKNRDENAD